MSDKKITPLDLFGAGHGDQPTLEEEQAGEALQVIVSALNGTRPSEDASPEAVELAKFTLDSMVSAIDAVSCDIGDDFGPCDKKHCPVCGGHYKMQIFSYPGPCCEGCRKKEIGDNEAYRMTAL